MPLFILVCASVHNLIQNKKSIRRLCRLCTFFFLSHISGGCSTASFVQKFSRIPTCSINSRTISIKKDRYSLHRKSGKKLPGITLVQNRRQQQQLIQKEILVPLSDQGFSVQKMNYGTPFVHRNMQQILIELQQRFQEKQERHEIQSVKFVITSAYRTTTDQKRLQRVNRNATKRTSSHSYGASVDIAKLSGKGCQKAVPLFQEVLTEMQAEKKLYLCPESNTIHITARVD